MAFNAAPTLYFGTTYTGNSTTLSIPTSAIPQLTGTEMAPTVAGGGDSRRMIWALVDSLASTYNATATDNRPGKMRLERTFSSVDPTTGNFTGTYSFSFDLNSTVLEVAAE
jgi:hypothetical protein